MKTLKRIKKDLGQGKKSKKGMSRGNATIVLAQGAVSAPRRNFGTQKAKGNIAALCQALDARIPRTLGLPRAVGPYTVIRTTVLHQSDSNFIMFCPFHFSGGFRGWYEWAGVESVNSAHPIVQSSTPNARPIPMPMSGLSAACEIVPAGLTVQVMNPNPLQTADGVFAMCRVNQQMDLGMSPAAVTFDDMIARVVSFYSPRLLTGGKLALRGVKCDAYPLNMSEYSDFMPCQPHSANFVWSPTVSPGALSPIVFVQNNNTPKKLQFMVTMEWRVRFDPGNPATSSHTHHDTLDDGTWNNIVKAKSAAGHGVEDIVEEVANKGMAVGKEILKHRI